MNKKAWLFAAAAGVLGICATAAYALPSHERWWIYYSDASKTTQVGYLESYCDGEIYLEGTITAHRTLIFEQEC